MSANISLKYKELYDLKKDHGLTYTVEELIAFPHYFMDTQLFEDFASLLD